MVVNRGARGAGSPPSGPPPSGPPPSGPTSPSLLGPRPPSSGSSRGSLISMAHADRDRMAMSGKKRCMVTSVTRRRGSIRPRNELEACEDIVGLVHRKRTDVGGSGWSARASPPTELPIALWNGTQLDHLGIEIDGRARAACPRAVDTTIGGLDRITE